MEKFIGREKELRELEIRFSSDAFEFIVIYGRRRVGKTMLIEQSINNRRCIFLQGTSNLKYNLEELSNQVFSLYSEYQGLIKFNSYHDFFRFLSVKTKDESLIVVFDEISYIAQADPSFLEILQSFIDHDFKKCKLKLILSGSSVHFMESNVMGPQSPLFGRRTLSLRVKPFRINESGRFLSSWSIDDKASAHVLTGGIPFYLKLLSSYKNLESALNDLFFTPTGFLYNEERVLFNSSVRALNNYEMVLSAMAGGANKTGDIANKVGLDKANVSSILQNLCMMGIVEEVYSIAPRLKKIGWHISDGYFAFYFRFIYPYRNLIERNQGIIVLNHTYENLNTFIGRRIEPDFIDYVLGNTLFAPERYGFSEFPNPINKQNEEIDLVAIDREGRYLFGECKWRNQKVGEDVLTSLARKASLLSSSVYGLYVCSKSGFTEEALEMAKHNNKFHLINGDKLLES